MTKIINFTQKCIKALISTFSNFHWLSVKQKDYLLCEDEVFRDWAAYQTTFSYSWVSCWGFDKLFVNFRVKTRMVGRLWSWFVPLVPMVIIIVMLSMATISIMPFQLKQKKWNEASHNEFTMSHSWGKSMNSWTTCCKSTHILLLKVRDFTKVSLFAIKRNLLWRRKMWNRE